jgi:putative transposase
MSTYQTRAEARQGVFVYIEVFYKRKRLQSAASYKVFLISGAQ